MAALLDFFLGSRKSSAETARDRLQIVIAHSRQERNAPSYLPQLKQELLEVIRRYVPVDQKDISISLEKSDGCEVMELNITLPPVKRAPSEVRRSGDV